VAGIIAGRTNTSRKVSGVAPKAKIMALKFLDENKSGATSNGIKAIRYAIAKKVKIINASWGSYNKSSAMQEVLKEAEKAGILFVAASGNYGGNNDSKPFYPASYNFPNILSVTASTSSDKWLSGINYGSKSVDFAAPGSSILSTDMNNGYKSRGGSSMAAPFVAGAAALALSINPNLKYKELKSILLQSSDRLNSLQSRVANGSRINLGKSVNTTNSKFNTGVGIGTIGGGGIQEDPVQEVCSTN
jgi:subtilisin family serine protease